MNNNVRRELKEQTVKNYLYRKEVGKAINVDPHVYNLLVECFAGGYTHSNCFSKHIYLI